MTRFDYDVSIVGYGPVAGLAALFLARSGLRVSIHERSKKKLELPRAVGIDGEYVRSFQRLGLGEQVDALLQPPRTCDEICFVNSKPEKIFSFLGGGSRRRKGTKAGGTWLFSINPSWKHNSGNSSAQSPGSRSFSEKRRSVAQKPILSPEPPSVSRSPPWPVRYWSPMETHREPGGLVEPISAIENLAPLF